MKLKKMLFLIPLFVLALLLFAEEMIYHFHNTGRAYIVIDDCFGTIANHSVDGEDFLWRSWVALSLDSLNENLIYAENNEEGTIAGGNIDTIPFTDFFKEIEVDSTYDTTFYYYHFRFYYDTLNDETLAFHEDSLPSEEDIDSLGYDIIAGRDSVFFTDSVDFIDTLVSNTNYSEVGYGSFEYDVEIFQRIYTEYVPEGSEDSALPYIPIEYTVINHSSETLRNAKFMFFYDSDIPRAYDQASFDLAEFSDDYRSAYIYYDGERSIESAMGFTVLSDCDYILGSYDDWYANGDSIEDIREIFDRPAQANGSGSDYYYFDTLVTVHDSTQRVFEDFIYDSSEFTIELYDSSYNEDSTIISVDTSESSYVLVDTAYIDIFESEMRFVEYYEYMPIYDSDSSIIGFEEVLVTDTIPAVSWADTFTNPVVYMATDAETSFVSRYVSDFVHTDYAVYVKFFIPDLAPGEEYSMEIALVGGGNIAQLLENAAQALDTTTTDTSDTVFFANNVEETKPESFELGAYPNPFNSTLNIENPYGGKIEVINLQGKVIDIIEENQTCWTADNITSGIYLLRPLNQPSAIHRVVYLK